MSNFSDFYGGGIKSVQRGVVNIGVGAFTGTTAITPVDPSKAVLSFLGQSTQGDTNIYIARLSMPTGNLVSADRSNNGGAATSINFQVVEYY